MGPRATGHRQRIGWPLLLAALLLLVLEVAVSEVEVPKSWRAAWRSLRNRRRRAIEAEPGYEELRANLARVREQHLQALRDGDFYRPDDPAVRARLYLARLDSRDR